MKYIIEDTTLTGIADSIRSKTGSTEGIKPTDMASAIDGIVGDGDYEIIEGIEIPLNLADGDQTIFAPEGSLVKSAIIKKPETLIPENIVKDIEIAGVVGTSVGGGGGGGSAEGFVTVTFMNGNTPVYSRPVYIGDDCPDPVTQKRIEAPTKESTVDTVYSYNGWALADGEAANSSALKNITEDKTLYAAYASSVRKYTITYYDEDGTTVLHTEQVEYGKIPSYAPTKQGYMFDKWTPTPTKVTGEASYSANWLSIIASGTCGTDVYWELDPLYNLVISGSGDMAQFSYETMPWYEYQAQIKSVSIKSGVTSIGEFSFYKCTSLTSVTIPNSVTTIGRAAFLGCSSLTSITIPDSVTSIGNSAFESCTSLTSIIIPNSVTNIDMWTFGGCSSLESVSIPNSVTSIGEHAFQNCTSLTSIIIPTCVTSILEYAFYNCISLESATIPDSVTSIGRSAFNGCNNFTDVYYSGSEEDRANISIGTSNNELTEATWHYNTPMGITGDCTWIYIDNVLTIRGNGDMEFYYSDVGPWGKNIEQVIIENGVKMIGVNAFYYCQNLTSAIIGNGVTIIGSFSFAYCNNLTSVTIGSNVAAIGTQAFQDCLSLTDVYYSGSEEDRANITINEGNYSIKEATWHYNHIF